MARRMGSDPACPSRPGPAAGLGEGGLILFRWPENSRWETCLPTIIRSVRSARLALTQAPIPVPGMVKKRCSRCHYPLLVRGADHGSRGDIAVSGLRRPWEPAYPSVPSRLTAAAARWSGGWHVRHRQPLGSWRSVHQRVPWQARHQAPGGGGSTSAVLGVCARLGGRSLTVSATPPAAAPKGGAARPLAATQHDERYAEDPQLPASLSLPYPLRRLGGTGPRPLNRLISHACPRRFAPILARSVRHTDGSLRAERLIAPASRPRRGADAPSPSWPHLPVEPR
jgi:hypothetical protein